MRVSKQLMGWSVKFLGGTKHPLSETNVTILLQLRVLYRSSRIRFLLCHTHVLYCITRSGSGIAILLVVPTHATPPAITYLFVCHPKNVSVRETRFSRDKHLGHGRCTAYLDFPYACAILLHHTSKNKHTTHTTVK
jgi:hypothetical protein